MTQWVDFRSDKTRNHEGGNVIINEFGYLITEDYSENDQITTIDDKKKKQIFFPNPNSSAYLSYFFNDSVGKNINICDLQGKSYIDFKSNKNSGQIDISQLSPGIYVITVHNNTDEVIDSRLLIRR